MITKVSSLSIFFPAYNDALSMPSLMETAFGVLPEIAEVYEVIVINDGSFDNTGEVLKQLQDRFGMRLRVIEHAENRGYGRALQTGFESAKYDWVFYTDGDGQYDVQELPRFIRELREGVGLVNGFKLQRSDPWHRTCIGWLYNIFARFLFGIQIRDIDCDFRLVRREIVQQLNLSSNTGAICVELIRGIESTGCEVVELGVRHYPRLHGHSQFFRVRSLLTTFQQLLDLYWALIVLPPLKRLRTILVWAR